MYIYRCVNIVIYILCYTCIHLLHVDVIFTFLTIVEKYWLILRIKSR